MDSKILQKIDEVKIITDITKLNYHIMKGDWLLLGAITNPEDNTIIYHIGHVSLIK